MPSFDHHGAHIHYEEFGQGFPILTFAPAGLASVIAVAVLPASGPLVTANLTATCGSPCRPLPSSTVAVSVSTPSRSNRQALI